eukprot:2143831-Pleurochrysis_carterae.AAC.2
MREAMRWGGGAVALVIGHPPSAAPASRDLCRQIVISVPLKAILSELKSAFFMEFTCLSWTGLVPTHRAAPLFAGRRWRQDA